MSKHRHLYQFRGCLLLNLLQYAAKRSAFSCKMHCVLLLNATRFGAKRKVKWCRMQSKMLLNARQKA